MTSSTPRTDRRLAWVLAGVVALTAGAGSAHASTEAEALFATGKQLLDEGRVAEACRAFERSFALDPLGGTLLGLAICHEQERKLGTALREYEKARDVAQAAGRNDRVARATRAIAALEPRVPRVIVDVSPAAREAGVEVKLDDVLLAPDEWNTAIPVDPGSHRLTWSSRGSAAGSASFEARESERARVEVRLEAATEEDESEEGDVEPMTVAAFVTGGAGVACLGVGAVLGIVALGKASDVDEQCDPSGCTREGLDAFESGADFALAADITLISGAALVGAGTVLFLLPALEAEGEDEEPVAVIRLQAGPARSGVTVSGRF